jgi:hypothetical protein
MNRSILGFAATVLLTATVHTGFAAEATHVPATALAAANADLIARADRALRDYVVAFSTGDEEAMARIVTSDAVIEYALKEPGTYLAVDAAALIAKRPVSSEPTESVAQVSTLWVFPTPNSNVVFVHYTTNSGGGSVTQNPDAEHLAVIEMRGDRIFRMRNFRNLESAQR